MLLKSFDPWRSPLCTCLNKLTFNPYTGCDHKCIYCYATSYIPNFHKCKPKKDLLNRLEKETPRLKGELISIANSSDPYPTIEKDLYLTRRCLKILSQCQCRVQIITKSDLVARDADVLREMSCVVALSITTEDDSLAKQLEPKAPSPSRRMRAIERLTQEDVPVCVRIDPIIPFLNDNPGKLIKTLATLGVKHITSSSYKVRQDNWNRFRQAFPETAHRLAPLYFKKGETIGGYRYLPKELRYTLMKNVKELTELSGMTFGTCRESFAQLNTSSCDGAEYCQRRQ